jgi:thioesterase domain-containing protein
MELVCALEGLVGRQLPLDAFNAESTAARMALALDSALCDPVASTHHNVFLLPGARGDTPGLAGLRADCMPEVSMQMVSYPGWREMLHANITLEGIAEVALGQICATSPEGPLCLIGYSFGVHVAFAIASALESGGRDVTQLVLIDMPPPNKCNRDTPAWSTHMVPREIWWEIDRLRRAARQGMAAERMAMIVAPFAAHMVRRWGLRAIATSRATNGLSQFFGDFGYWTTHHMGQEFRRHANREWALRWRAPAKRLRAPVLLIRSAEHREDAPEDLGWGELAEHIRVVHVQGTHVSMLSAANRKAVSGAVGLALAQALSAPNTAADRMSLGLG